MKINTLYLQNFRCFEELTVEFHPQMNILIGDNASGKTAVLEAVGELLAPFIRKMIGAQTLEDSSQWGWHLEKNIRRKLIADNKEYLLPYKQALYLTNGIKSNYELPDIPEEDGIYIQTVDISGGMQLEDFASKLKRKRTENVNFPIIAYYSTARLWSSPKQEANGHKANGSRLEGYLNAFPVNDTTFKELRLRWNTLEQEEWLSGNVEPALIAMKQAIMTVIESCKNVYFSNKQGTLVFQNIQNEIYPFSLLSDGYRNMLAMISDMAYRCCTLNSHLKENACLETEGIVLIDEIDLHLHPKWQKEIIGNLKKAFPKIQFILSTHSPFIIQSALKEEVHKLVGAKEKEIEQEPFKLSIEEVA